MIKGVIVLFVLIILINLFFRIRVLKHYRYLISKRIDFNPGDIFNEKKLNEIAATYPDEEKNHILAFGKNIRVGVYLTSLIIVIIAVLYIWMKN